MANMSTYLANKLLDHYLGGSAYTQPTPYLALFTTAPTMPAGTGGVEVSGGSYARVALSGSNMAAAASEAKSSNASISFPTATGNWGTVVAVGVYDALTTGNLLEAGNLTNSATITTSTTFSIASGNLASTLS